MQSRHGMKLTQHLTKRLLTRLFYRNSKQKEIDARIVHNLLKAWLIFRYPSHILDPDKPDDMTLHDKVLKLIISFSALDPLYNRAISCFIRDLHSLDN